MSKLLIMRLIDDDEQSRSACHFPENSFGVSIALRDCDMMDLVAYPEPFAQAFVMPGLTQIGLIAVDKGLKA